MQTRICFPIAAGKMETFFFTSYLAEISFTSSYSDLQLQDPILEFH